VHDDPAHGPALPRGTNPYTRRRRRRPSSERGRARGALRPDRLSRSRGVRDAPLDWFQDEFPNRPYTVVGAARAAWLFAGTGLRDGSRFGGFGIEIDARTEDSPPGTRVLARIPAIFGPGKSAEMTYYETRGGAKVFAAGVLNFGGAAWYPEVARMVENVWARLSRP
jgi:N,N-dimethylformamidase beta subunit-like, C-terminal